MLCENCQNSDATVHLTQVLDGVVKKLHLCEPCAKNSGMEIKGPMSISDVLLGLGSGSAMGEAESRADSKSCGNCGLKLSDFRKRGRLGCAKCYECFDNEIMPLLKSMHHSIKHVGKVPSGARQQVELDGEIAKLQEVLEAAVKAEDFEQAAVLRDQIAELRAATAAKEN